MFLVSVEARVLALGIVFFDVKVRRKPYPQKLPSLLIMLESQSLAPPCFVIKIASVKLLLLLLLLFAIAILYCGLGRFELQVGRAYRELEISLICLFGCLEFECARGVVDPLDFDVGELRADVPSDVLRAHVVSAIQVQRVFNDGGSFFDLLRLFKVLQLVDSLFENLDLRL